MIIGVKSWGRVALLLALAACGAAPPPLAPIPLRNPTAPVAAQSDADVARLDGRWRIVAGAPDTPGTVVEVRTDSIRIGDAALPFAQTGAGRFVMAGQTLWVHWIDADNRTAVLGDPDGGRVWILDRSEIGPDRLSAAREILDWYGYDLRRIAGIAP